MALSDSLISNLVYSCMQTHENAVDIVHSIICKVQHFTTSLILLLVTAVSITVLSFFFFGDSLQSPLIAAGSVKHRRSVSLIVGLNQNLNNARRFPLRGRFVQTSDDGPSWVTR